MIALWTISSAVLLVIAVWYLGAIFNAYGQMNYPPALRKLSGHLVSWALVGAGFLSLVLLRRTTQDSRLFLEITGGILFFVLLVDCRLASMTMAFKDVMGSLYSAGGLRFGGFRTSDFLGETEGLEGKRCGAREEIIAEAHYLVYWLHKLPEIAFLFGIVFYESAWMALSLFVLTFLLEMVRFYTFGPSPILSRSCRIWTWLEVPIIVICAVGFWPQKGSLCLILSVFMVAQVWLDLIASVAMFPMRIVVAKVICSVFGGPWHNIEGSALHLVLRRWQARLLPIAKQVRVS